MPFEIAPQEVSVADKLAALIETGRAANPEMRHNHRGWGDGEKSGCAMTFAFKAAGLPMTALGSVFELAKAMSVDENELYHLSRAVMGRNDGDGDSIEEIVSSLRDGSIRRELRTYVHVLPNIHFGAIKHINKISDELMKQVMVTYYGDPAKFTLDEYIGMDFAAPEVKAVPQPAKKVRTSAKTGASWPVAKGCYA